MKQSLTKKVSLALTLAMLSFGSLTAAEAASADIDTKPGEILETVENALKNEPGKQDISSNVVRSEQQKEEKTTQVIQAKPDLPSDTDYEQRYDFDWQGTPLNTSLYAISKVSGKKVVINGDLKGTVYTTLKQVTYNEALSYLSKAFNFNYMIDGSAIMISTSDVMLQNDTFHIRYVYNMQNIKDEIKSMGIDEDSIFVNNNQGTVSVSGTPYQLSQVRKRLAAIDKPVQQCLLIAQLIEVDHGDKLDLGMQYSLPTYSHSGVSAGRTDDLSFRGNWGEKLTFSASANAAKELNKGKVIARPMIITHNGEAATFNMSSSIPIMTSTATSSSTTMTVEYKDVGTIMTVKPLINTIDNKVSLSINAEVSNVVGWVTSGQSTAPQVNKKVADTAVTVKNGQSFIIGGLMSAEEIDNLSGIPGLMDIPILGKLFSYHKKSKTYSEIFIMVTPYIVSDDIDPKALLRGVN